MRRLAGFYVKGTKDVEANLQASAVKIEKATRRAALRAGIELHRRIVYSIDHEISQGTVYTHEFLTDKKTGRIFPYKERNKPHTASAPGDPPNTDKGRLVGALHIGQVKTVGGKVVIKVLSADNKSAWLEYGTKKMAARPFMRPALLQMKKTATKIYAEEVRRVL